MNSTHTPSPSLFRRPCFTPPLQRRLWVLLAIGTSWLVMGMCQVFDASGVNLAARNLLAEGPADHVVTVGELPCQTLSIPALSSPVLIDGQLDENCYTLHPPLASFQNAAQGNVPAETKAWVFWSPEHLTFSFDCADSTPAAAKPGPREKDVDPQDRVELFLWSGEPEDPYYCIEIASLGAVHDYQARFYRQFDDSWNAASLTTKVKATPQGYVVEARISRDELAQCGFELKPRQSWRAGLFRADFDALDGVPTWITWIDAGTPEPDFHVASAFGIFTLSPAESP